MKRFVASSIASLVATWSLAVTTGPIEFKYGGDPQVPNYWSGTNCKVEFTCSSVGSPGDPGVVEPTITGYDVLIGGELTQSWRKANLAPNSFAVAAAIVFDSTHFSNNSLLQIQVKVYTVENGVQGEKIGNSTPERYVRNRARLLTHGDFLTHSWVIVDTANYLQQGKFHVTSRANSDWLRGDLRQDLQTSTVFSIVTHGLTGSPGTRWFDNNYIPSGPNPETWRFYAHLANDPVFSVQAARVEGTGVNESSDPADLPPYNPGEPPCTISYIGACLTGSEAPILGAYTWPPGTRYIPYPPGGKDDNEAVVAYAIIAWHPGLTYAEREFWRLLMQGYTVSETVTGMAEAYNLATEEYSNHPSIVETDFVIHGDPLAKAKGVYLGLSKTDWWRLAQ